MQSDRGMMIKAISVLGLFGTLGFLTACGGSSSSVPNPVTGRVTIGLARAATFVDPGQSVNITANPSRGDVSWSLSPATFGTLSNQSANSVTYTAPTPVTDTTSVSIIATSTTQTNIVASIEIGVRNSPLISLSVQGPQTLNQGQLLSVNATLTGDTTNQGVVWSLSSAVGTLSNQSSTSVTYNAPGSVTGNTPVTLIATSVANSHSVASVPLTIYSSGAGPNVAALSTANGTSSPSTNSPFITVTVCRPATSDCQTIDNVLVDTGSEGLRLLQSVVEPLVLPQAADGTGGFFNNCVQFLDGSYLWGPVQFADIKIGGETSSNTPIQAISSGSPTVPTSCTQGGTVNENTPQLLGANGILGIGLEPTDCILQGTDFCNGSTSSIPSIYFDCPASGCISTDGPSVVSTGNEVTNPVAGLSGDNNGTAITMPALASSSAEVDGSLIFGIGTKSNNAIPGTATVFGLDANDNFITLFNSQTLNASFIDSGSNGLFFPSTIATCTDNAGFYCPATTQPLTATQEDAAGQNPTVVNFSIENADTLFSSSSDSAFSTLGGPLVCTGSNCSFDWGMPFFYGKTVFTAIDGQSNAFGNLPFWAY
jgi:Protein of unknown function (DUF3443)